MSTMKDAVSLPFTSKYVSMPCNKALRRRNLSSEKKTSKKSNTTFHFLKHFNDTAYKLVLTTFARSYINQKYINS
jgi:hypothetical protein